MRRLLIRPKIHRDEWWDGYVARTLAANGHAPTREYMLRKLEPFVSDLVAPQVKSVATAGEPAGKSVRRFSGWTLPTWAVRGATSAAAHCPACLADDPYIRIGWRLRAVTHCEAHSQPLRTCCAICAQSVHHWDLARGRCRCGEPLAWPTNSTTDRPCANPASSSIGSSDNWLFSSTVPHQAVESAGLGSAGGTPEDLLVLVFLGALLPALAKVAITGQAPPDRTIAAFLRSHALQLRSSISCVEQVFTSLRSAGHLRVALNVVLALLKEESNSPTVLSQLPLQGWAELLCSLSASPRSAERLGLIEPGTLMRGLMPLKAAAKEAGIRQMHLKSLMKKGVVAPIRTLQLGARQHLFSREQVEYIAQFRPQGYGYGNSLRLGLAPHRYGTLRDAGIVGTVIGYRNRTWLDGEALRALFVALEDKAIRVEAVEESMLCLSSALIWQRRLAPVLKAFFEKLLSGDLQLWIQGDRPGFERFFVGLDSLEFLQLAYQEGLPSETGTQKQGHLQLVGGASQRLSARAPWARQSRRPSSRERHEPLQQLTLELGS